MLVALFWLTKQESEIILLIILGRKLLAFFFSFFSYSCWVESARVIFSGMSGRAVLVGRKLQVNIGKRRSVHINIVLRFVALPQYSKIYIDLECGELRFSCGESNWNLYRYSVTQRNAGMNGYISD